MTFSPFNSHTNQIFVDLKLLKVRDLISMSQLGLVHDFLNERLPIDLMSFFRLSGEVYTTSRELRSTVNRLIYIPKFKTIKYGKDSIRYKCAKLWNSTFKTGYITVDDGQSKNVNVHNITVRAFKTILKKHFLHSYTIQPEIIYD